MVKDYQQTFYCIALSKNYNAVYKNTGYVSGKKHTICHVLKNCTPDKSETEISNRLYKFISVFLSGIPLWIFPLLYRF